VTEPAGGGAPVEHCTAETEEIMDGDFENSTAERPSGEAPTDYEYIRAAADRLTGGHHPAPHPDIAAIQRDSEAWRARFGFGTAKDFTDTQCAGWASYSYPSLPRPVVQIAADLIGWLFLYDDEYGEHREPGPAIDTARRHVALLRTGIARRELDAFELALLDLRARVLEYTDERFVDRFASSFAKSYAGWHAEIPYRRAGKTPSLEAYRRLRAWSVGMHTLFDIAELHTGHPSDAELPEVDQLRDEAALLCGYINDVHSYLKERDEPINLIAVLRDERGITPAAAAEAATQEYAFQRSILDAHCAAVLRRGSVSDAMRQIVSGLIEFVPGCAEWYGKCGRYYELDDYSMKYTTLQPN
jgi:terpene synthase-like protein